MSSFRKSNTLQRQSILDSHLKLIRGVTDANLLKLRRACALAPGCIFRINCVASLRKNKAGKRARSCGKSEHVCRVRASGVRPDADSACTRTARVLPEVRVRVLYCMCNRPIALSHQINAKLICDFFIPNSYERPSDAPPHVRASPCAAAA